VILRPANVGEDVVVSHPLKLTALALVAFHHLLADPA
jgi:hypothetical protein